jgi:hypothetical protein
MRVLLLSVALCAVLVLCMNAQGWAQGPAWVIDPGKSYGPYYLGMSVREVGTLLKWPSATITEVETTASSTTLHIPPGNTPVGFVFESSALTSISVSVRDARTPSGVGVGSTLPDVLRVFGGDPRTEFRSYGSFQSSFQRPGPRCLIATVDYDAANARSIVDVEYRDRGITFMLVTTAQRPQLLVELVEVFAPQACLPGD